MLVCGSGSESLSATVMIAFFFSSYIHYNLNMVLLTSYFLNRDTFFYQENIFKRVEMTVSTSVYDQVQNYSPIDLTYDILSYSHLYDDLM